MPSFTKLALLSFSALIVGVSAHRPSYAHQFLRRATDASGNDIPAVCITPCDSLFNSTLECSGQAIAGAVAGREPTAAEIAKVYECACNAEVGAFVQGCVSCMFANVNEDTIEDAGYDNLTIESFNEGCIEYATNISKAWANTTLTTSGSLGDKKSGAGAAFVSFGALVGLVGAGMSLLA